MGNRQRGVHPNSSLGEKEFRFNFANLTADYAQSIYLADVDRVEITEVGSVLTSFTGLSNTLDLQVKWQNDAGDPDDPAVGTVAYSQPNNYARQTAANNSKSKRFYADGESNPVIPCPKQTLNNTDRRGVLLKLMLDFGGTVTDADGWAWVRYRPYRREDL